MTWLIGPGTQAADIGRLTKESNFRNLIRLLGHRDFPVQQQAAMALGSLGEKAILPLLASVDSPDPAVRLGIVEVLGSLKDIRAIKPLIHVLDTDRRAEVRWASALALGQIGSPLAIPALVKKLEDKDRYVRRSAAQSLRQIGWQPESERDRAIILIALHDWEGVRSLGQAAAGPLQDRVGDNDPATRSAIIPLLARLGDRLPVEGLRECMKDRDPRIRWQAVSAAMDYGISPGQLPRIIAGRHRTGPVPLAAALLNFLFLGLGYNYIGKWWGFPVFMSYMTILVLAQLAVGPFIPYLFAYPITGVFAVQTYFAAKRMSDF
jgi:HEAT repeat protein